MSNQRKVSSPMPDAVKAEMEKSLANVGPMPIDNNALPSFDEGGPEYQARADRCQMEYQAAWRKRIETMYWAAHESKGSGLTAEYIDHKRLEYLLNFIFPRGTVERLIFETGWETVLEVEYSHVPDTVKREREKQQKELQRRILLAGPNDLPPGFSKS